MLHLIKRTLLIAVIFAWCSALANGQNMQDAQLTEWGIVKESDGITIFANQGIDAQGQPFSRYRGTGRVTINDPYSLVAILNDFEHYPDWFPIVSSAKEIDRDNYFNRHIYIIAKFPVIADRDIVTYIQAVPDINTNSVSILIENKYDYLPMDTDYIRFKAFDGLLKGEFISATEAEVTIEIQSNAGGIIPASLTEYLTVYFPYLVIQNLREIVKNPGYHNLQTDTSEIRFDGGKLLPQQ